MSDKQALHGVKVLELARFIAGPYCAKLLADMGTETIKIEKPGVGDEARKREPFLNDIPHSERSGLFLYLNTNKLGITLNLDSPTGNEIFKKLVQDVDVLIEDNPPQELAEKGIGYENLRQINPKLIMTSITPFGQTGPYRDYKAYYLNTCHAGGIGYLTPLGSSYPDRPPLKWGGYSSEYACGLVSAVATLGALYSQRLNGMGQHIDVSKQEALLSLAKVFVACYANEERIADRFKGLLQGDAARRLFSATRCQDGYALLVPIFERQLESLEKLLGSSESEQAKDRHQRIAQWLASETKEEVYTKGQAARIPAAPIRDVSEVVNSEQYEARAFFTEVEHPQMGRVKIPTAPYQFSKTPWSNKYAAPLLGQHNEEVYCHRLGYSKQDLVMMRQTGII